MSEFARQEDQYKPRERMLTAASAAELRADELLAILLRTGAAGCDVLELSRRILASYSSMEELVKSDWRTLREHVREYNAGHPDKPIKGLGKLTREVFREAIRWGAHAVFVAHNHPHGDVLPSEADKNVTRQLVETSRSIGIPLLDHLVIGSSRMLSGRHYVSIRASNPESFGEVAV